MKDKICNKYIKSILIPIIICFLISTILEITLFNFRYPYYFSYSFILVICDIIPNMDKKTITVSTNTIFTGFN